MMMMMTRLLRNLLLLSYFIIVPSTAFAPCLGRGSSSATVTCRTASRRLVSLSMPPPPSTEEDDVGDDNNSNNNNNTLFFRAKRGAYSNESSTENTHNLLTGMPSMQSAVADSLSAAQRDMTTDDIVEHLEQRVTSTSGIVSPPQATTAPTIYNMVPWIGPAPGDVSMLMVMFFIAIFWIVQDTQQIMTTSATATTMAFDVSSTFA